METGGGGSEGEGVASGFGVVLDGKSESGSEEDGAGGRW